MQDVTPWPESFDVSEPVARVLVDGQEVNVESVSVSSELDSAMPDRVAAGGGGVVAATGSASVLRPEDVAEAGFNPWGDAQRFVEASEIVIEAGYRDPTSGKVGCARQITGQVESLDGGARSHNVGLEYVDHTPSLDRDITIEPLLQHYPPLEDWGPMRGAGLSPIYITDRVLRHCGFYATPPLLSGAIVSAPMMGSVVPERGTLWSSWAASNEAHSAAFRPVPWGMALGNGVVSYHPVFGSRGHGRLTSSLHVSFHRLVTSSSDSTYCTIDLFWGESTGNAIRVLIQSTGNVRVAFRNAGVWEYVTTVPASLSGESDTFSVTIEPSGQATIYASNGAVSSGRGTLPDVALSQNMREVVVDVPQHSSTVGGVQVAFSAAQNHMFRRTAHIDPPAHHYSLHAFPAQLGVNCLSLLKDQAEAELAAMWVDEYGHFRWRNRHQLRDLAPRGTLTSQHDLLDLPWQVPVRSVFSRVDIEHEVATITRRGVPSITVSDRRGSTLSNGDTEDLFLEPPANQDWHEVATPQWMGGSPDLSDIRRGRGSYRGGVIVDEDNNERLAYSSRLNQTWSQINPQRWLLSSEAHNLASTESIEQSFLDRPDWYGRFAEEALPIIRAKGLVEWEPHTTTGASRGPRLAPVLVHPVGPWVQNKSELQSLADWLADYLTKPDVILRNIPIVPDPRIQLGDTFWLEDQNAYQVRLKIVVMGKTLKYQASDSGPEMTQEITCRVIDMERLSANYNELETSWAGRDYDAFEQAWEDQNYTDLEADPLDRS